MQKQMHFDLFLLGCLENKISETIPMMKTSNIFPKDLESYTLANSKQQKHWILRFLDLHPPPPKKEVFSV